MAIVSNYIKSYLKSYVASYIFSDASWFSNPDINLDGNAPSWISEYNNNRYALSGAEVAQSVANTFTRATTGTVVDFEDIIKTAALNEMRLSGLRRVENLVVDPNDLTGAWNTSNASSITTISGGGIGGRDATDVVFNPATSQDVRQTISNGDIENRTFRYTLSVKGIGSDVGKNVRITLKRQAGAGSTVTIEPVLTGDYIKYDLELTGIATSDGIRLGIELATTGTPAIACRVCDFQVDEVTGQANQNPASFVDGVEYLTYENGNTVASNVVSEANGADIADATRLGFLSERSSTNIVTRSEVLDAFGWNNQRVTTSAAGETAPDGRPSAYSVIVDGTASVTHNLFHNSISSTATVEHTASGFYKAGTAGTNVQLRSGKNTGANAVYLGVDLSTGLEISQGVVGTAVITRTSITAFSNGWYRLSISFTEGSANTGYSCTSRMLDGTSDVFSGNNTDFIYAWGFQLEVGGYCGAYIPTEASAVTRAIDSDEAALSAVYNDDEGVIYWEGYIPERSGTNQHLFRFDDGSFNNVIRVYRTATTATLKIGIRNGGVYQVEHSIDSSLVDGEYIKIAISYALNNVIISYNGVTSLIDTAAINPVGINRYVVGSGNSQPLNENTSAMRYYDKAATEAELNKITTL